MHQPRQTHDVERWTTVFKVETRTAQRQIAGAAEMRRVVAVFNGCIPNQIFEVPVEQAAETLSQFKMIGGVMRIVGELGVEVGPETGPAARQRG